MHPYEMYQVLLSRHEDHLVKVRPGSLYHTVTRLAEQGLARAEGTDRAGNRPERTIYTKTDAGGAALRDRIAEVIRRPVNEFPLFPLAMSEAHSLPVAEVIELIEERIAHRHIEIGEADAVLQWVTGRNIPRRYWMVLELLRAQGVAEVTWLTGVLADLRDGSLPWEPEPGGDHRDQPDPELGHDWASAVTDDALDRIRKGGALPVEP
ncbi:PadR family transcriptional regulator [Nocardia stercoris]|uniref:PadR family transcriptional regulator n=2 Tax=Nocardia stercoris TaxID=2483361 RepID=A0A3M2LDY0_9NOCA|nr:PadR family transcriptional regulator [Nocardia stercoris]